MNNVSFPKPVCARCRKTVTSLSAERRGPMLIFSASCHGQIETMVLPTALLKDPNLKIGAGVAFEGVDMTT